jgi:transcriptional regulator with XRE-family HTH domain
MDGFAEIETRRNEAGISQSELCRTADVHPTTYMKILNGRSAKPHRRTLVKLRKALEQLQEEAV